MDEFVFEGAPEAFHGDVVAAVLRRLMLGWRLWALNRQRCSRGYRRLGRSVRQPSGGKDQRPDFIPAPPNGWGCGHSVDEGLKSRAILSVRTPFRADEHVCGFESWRFAWPEAGVR